VVPSDPRIRQGGVAGGAGSARGLETHRCPHAVPIKRCALARLCSRGSYLRARVRGRVPGRAHVSHSSVEGRRERVSNQAQGLPDQWPRTAVRAQRRNAVRAGIGSMPARSTRLELGVGLTRSRPSCCHELLHVKRSAPVEHVVRRPTELVRENRQGFALAMFPLELLEQALAFGILA